MGAVEEPKRVSKEKEKRVRREKRQMEREERNQLPNATMGPKAHAITTDTRREKRRKEATKQKGKQVPPASFTKYLGRIHRQQSYARLEMEPFRVEERIDEIMVRAIRGGGKTEQLVATACMLE